jgi:hypothetical protein
VKAAVLVGAYAILLFLLVRPGSKGPGLVTAISNGLANIIKAGTGGGTWAKG